MSVPVSIAAYILLKPEDMRSFGMSLALQFVSLQNVLFLSEGEYFRGADMKPLLHTWTLAVEEQFYLLWPLLLLFTRRVSFKIKMLLLGVIMLGSFGLNLVLMNISPKASFLLLPPRAWELGAGGLAALLETKVIFRSLLSERIRATLALVGLFAILYSVFKFTSETPFPGTAALLPVIGAVFLLVSGIGSLTFVGRFLTLPWMVRIGLLSYPMYLWHWPLASLLRQFKLDPTQPIFAATIVFVTIGLAELTYRFVELPIRQRKWLPTTKSLLISAGTGFGLLIAFGLHAWITNGAAYRYSPVARSLLTAPLLARSDRCGFVFKALHPKDQVCAMHKDSAAERRILLWGNSHADMWSGLFTSLANERGVSFYLNARNCRATTDHDFCGKPIQQAILGYIASEHITDVVLSSTWYGSYGIADEVFEHQLREVISKLTGVKVWLVVDVPDSVELDPVVAYEKNPSNPIFGYVLLSDYVPVKHQQQLLFDSLSRDFSNVRIIDPSFDLCNITICSGGLGEISWYRDRNHLSDAGAMVAKSQFLPVFINLKKGGL
jgi:peptidoglycan/LPS O-acetylase OafA/YrhL